MFKHMQEAARRYDGSGRHEVRNEEGRLIAQGDLAFCYRRLNEVLERHTYSEELPPGWTLLPHADGVIEAEGETEDPLHGYNPFDDEEPRIE